jgi:hypothetical protein
MIHATTMQQVIDGRRTVRSGTGEEHWRTEFMLARDMSPDDVAVSPQAFLVEMTPAEVIMPHFHEVEQFQVFIHGEGQLGRVDGAIRPLVVHYTDASTGYGPITASENGLSYFALRPRKDPGAVYLHKDGYRERLKPSLKRHFSVPVTKSTKPVLSHLAQPVVEQLFNEDRYSLKDGLAASMVRLGAAQSYEVASPQQTGGQYLIVVQGKVKHAGQIFKKWSLFFVEPEAAPICLEAGDKGAEFLVLQFGKRAVV